MGSRKDFETVSLEIDDGIATLTLNRPDKMNTFNYQMMQDVIACFDITDADDDVKAVIVTGAGEKAFCAGMDLSEGGTTFDVLNSESAGETGLNETELQRDWGGVMTLRIFESFKPVIGAINGAAVGIGATMQLPMDVRIASDNARFGFVFARLGITPEACSSYFLSRVVGISQALDWCYKGKVFGADEAKSGGLVKEVYPQDELMNAAKAWCREIIDNTAPVSVAMVRRMLWEMLGADHPMEAHKIDSRAIFERGRSGDSHEGVNSFVEKRKPVYKDKVSDGIAPHYPWYPARQFQWPEKVE